jgi:hypothetical protein
MVAGREAEWETLAEEIRREHGRKWSFMREFEEIAPAPPGQ